MLKELMINYVENLPVNNSGNFKFRMEWMRGQLICYAYLQKGEEGEQCYINWTCDPSKLKNCELGIGKISENVLSFQVGLGKANANIGTIDRLVIYEMCSSGSIAIHGTKT